MSHNLVEVYEELGVKECYYERLKWRTRNNKFEYVTHNSFLQGVSTRPVSVDEPKIVVTSGDLRVDAPVWFGDLASASLRVVVIGMEPRATNNQFNIEEATWLSGSIFRDDHKTQRIIYGSPFGADRWNKNSSVRGRPQNKYMRTFHDLLSREDTFCLFTDFVKDYIIMNAGDSRHNDAIARKRFKTASQVQSSLLLKELAVVDPDLIIVLGVEAHRAAQVLLPPSHGSRFKNVPHPAHGGERQAKQEISGILSILKGTSGRPLKCKSTLPTI